jgi:hypothetical protein
MNTYSLADYVHQAIVATLTVFYSTDWLARFKHSFRYVGHFPIYCNVLQNWLIFLKFARRQLLAM